MNNRKMQIHVTDIPWLLLAGLLLVSLVQAIASFISFSRFTLVHDLISVFDVLYVLLLAFLCFQGSPRLLRTSSRLSTSHERMGRRFIPAFLGMGMLCVLLASLIWVYETIRTQQIPTYPSPVSFAYIGAYLCFIAAFLLLPSQNLSKLSRLRILLDSLIIMITIITLYCYAVLVPILAMTRGTFLEKIVGSLFTAADLVLLFCLLLVALRTGEIILQRVIVLLTLAVLVFFVGDVVALSHLLPTRPNLMLRPNLGWLVSLALITVATRMMSRALRTDEFGGQGSPVLLEDTGMSAHWKIFLTAAPVLIFALLALFLLMQRESVGFAARFAVVDIGGTLILILLVLRQLLAMHEVNTLKQALRVKNAQLEELATHDPLTGALNHRTLVEKLEEELTRAREKQTICSILFLDIDHFKAINDQHGHLVGDLVLCQSARLVISILRSADGLGRWGGEEFIAILPGRDLNSAHEVAEAIRVEVSQQVFASEKTLRVTCSLGIATYPKTAASRDSLINAADQAMYVAKLLGRNQICLAEPEKGTNAESGAEEV